jgi:tetratricopeptide (TPR) repeat protein
MSYREDFIKRLISQFFQVLYKIMGLIQKKDIIGASEMVSQIRQELLGISESLANDLSSPDLIRMLSAGEEPNPAKPLILAELFKVQGDIESAQDREEACYTNYLKALDLLLEIAFQTKETSFPEEFTSVEAIADLLEEYVLPPDTLAALFHFYESAGQYAQAEETLFDFIEDSPNPAEALEVGFHFVERLRVKTAGELAASELTPEDLDDIQAELQTIQASLNK